VPRDGVAHECAHALVDGLAAWLYDATSPQSPAIHEAVADLCALLTSFRSGTLVRAVLEHTGGTIRDSTAFSSLATEVASALAGEAHPRDHTPTTPTRRKTTAHTPPSTAENAASRGWR
jgi:hypothetical protein